VYNEYPSFAPIKTAVETDDVEKMIEAAKAWLSRPGNSKWLLVIDNANISKTYTE
jgi:Holliday junction resolvase-like predicted endonuclease